MKKILFAVFASLFVGIAPAQFKVQEKASSPVRVWAGLGGHEALYYYEENSGDHYYFMGFNTTNQFDKKMIINLGKKDKAKATLSQLVNELYAQGEIYKLIDDAGEAFTLQCAALNQYVITKQGYAGRAYLTVGQASKMLYVLKE